MLEIPLVIANRIFESVLYQRFLPADELHSAKPERDSLVDKLHALEQALAQAQRQNAELQAQAQEREGITAELRERLEQAVQRLDQEVQARARLEGILDTLRQQPAKRSAKSTPTQA